MNFIDIEIDILFISLTIAFIYGLSPITFKLLVLDNNISFQTYFLISASIFFVCTLIYLLIFFNFNNILKELKNINNNILFLLFLNVVLVLFFSQILYYYLLKKTDKISKITVIIGLYPLITLILSIFVLKEEISIKTFIGFIISILGICIINF
jgi:drug/metabolite transporter (DMT)-like permease